MMTSPFGRVFALALLVVSAGCAARPPAEPLRVAVAANFQVPAEEIVRSFEQATGHDVEMSAGSTGALYAQITHGAPFDVFLAADQERPRRLEDEATAVAGSRFTYALGRLALWSPRPGFVDDAGEVLAGGGFERLALANPRLAPYGAAARQVLEARGLWAEVEGKIVLGQDVGQAYQFIASGNAALGFVPLSYLDRPGWRAEGSWWLVPEDLHDPIAQDAVLLTDSPTARAFLDHLRSEPVRRLIRDFGYGVPEG